MAVEKCQNCRFYNTEDCEIEDIPYERTCGFCRRYPPKRVDGNFSGYPVVEEDWWCGEYQNNLDKMINNFLKTG